MWQSREQKRGGGIRRKFLSKAQLIRKVKRNAQREEEFKLKKIVDEDYMLGDRKAFLRYLESNTELMNRLLNDPIQEVVLNDKKDAPPPIQFCGTLQEDSFFEMREKGKLIATKKARTNMNMNPVSGFCLVPEWEGNFQEFVRDRDQTLKQEARVSARKRMQDECSRSWRSEEKLEDLFDAVADCFRGDEPQPRISLYIAV